MPLYKRCSRCGARILVGATCACMPQWEAMRQRDYDIHRRNKKSRNFYNSGEWRAARQQALLLDEGIDVYLYMTKGQIAIADVVHHIIPLSDDWNKRTDVNNLMSLHHTTHGELEKMYKADKREMVRKLQQMLREYRAKMSGG